MNPILAPNGINARAFADLVGGEWLAEPGVGPVLGASIDTRTLEPGQVFFALAGDRVDGHDYLDRAEGAGCPLAVVERGVGRRSGAMGVLRVENARVALARLAGAWRRALPGLRVIGVTGSNGKTTTVRMLGAALSAGMKGSCAPGSFNNDLGVPLTLLAARPGDGFVVCEIGTNAPGEIAPLAALARPDVAVVTSIGRSHLEGLGSVAGVAGEKADLVRALPTGGLAVVCAGSAELDRALAGCRGIEIVRVGAGAEADVTVEQITPEGGGVVCRVGRVRVRSPLPGVHNAVNAAMALVVAERQGVDPERAAQAIGRAEPPPMRLERVTIESSGGPVYVVNDAYNANPESMRASIETFASGGLDPAGWTRQCSADDAPGGTGCPEWQAAPPGSRRRLAVVGEMLEMGAGSAGAHEEIAGLLARADIDGVVLIGSHAERMTGVIEADRPGLVLMGEADAGADWSARAATLIRAGDLVLLKGSRGVRLERLLDTLRRSAV